LGLILIGILILAVVKQSDFNFVQKKPIPITDFQQNFLPSIKYMNSANSFIAVNKDGEINSLSALSILSKDEQMRNFEVVREIVLPSNVWKYKVQKNETLSQIAYKFRVPLGKILALNGLNEKSMIRVGQTINLPAGVRVRTVSRGNIIARIPIVGKFIEALSPIGEWLSPVSGYNQKEIHSNNGIDVSSQCGQPVYSANSGIVIESFGGWNGGYGNYIKIQHNDGSLTLYGHLSARYAQSGSYVEKGTLIGAVGNTGDVQGKTGCHLHFEVRGGKNFLLK
jgi:LysM repeat protein